MYTDLIQNIVLMVALTTLYSLMPRLLGHGKTRGKILSGLLFGGVAVIGMHLPFHYAPGVIYDGRSIILALAGLFGGGMTAAVSAVTASAYRAYLGGAGIWAGLATIIACAGIGLVFRQVYGNRPDRMGLFSLYGFGISVHVVMLACQLLIQPWPSGLAVMNRIWLPILLIFPTVTVLMGSLLGTVDRRIQAEHNLRESESLLSRSQSIGNVGSWEYDVAGNRFTCSDEVYRIFGLRPREFEASREAFLDFVHPDDHTAVGTVYGESIRAGSGGYQIEHRIIRHNSGEVRIVYQKCEHFKDASGRIVRSIGMVQDITERKKAEDEIRELNRNLELRVKKRTAALEEVNKELQDFVYSVSHDLRAPLRSISGFAEIIDRRHKTSLNEEGQHYFDNIVQASRQMGELIDDLLKFSRLGRNGIRSETVSLDDVVKAAVDTLSDQIKKTGARVTLPGQMPAIQGNVALVNHIFINLLENALKYHKPDDPPLIDIGFEIKDRYIIISVADNGIGIAPEYHEKIFAIFQRLHSQGEYPGTGIGLATVKKAVQIMGGQAWVESEPDKGSVFKIKVLMSMTASFGRIRHDKTCLNTTG